MHLDRDEYIKQSFMESAEVKLKTLEKCLEEIKTAINVIEICFQGGHKLLLCGNGGSAADCQHIATELTIRLNHDIRRRGLPAVALPTDSSAMTGGGNDIGFENTFARLVEALGNEGDVLIAISTSGNSENILRAADKARENRIAVIGFLGSDGGKLKSHCDLSIMVPSFSTQRIQEAHITIGHTIAELVEYELSSK